MVHLRRHNNSSRRTEDIHLPALLLFVIDATMNSVIREWWTRDTRGVTCEPPLTPQAIIHDVTTGDYRVAGRATVGEQPALKLESSMTTTGTHPETKMTTLSVNSTTYLPIQSTSLGRASEQTVFSWLPATSVNASILNVKVPAGFRHVAATPSPNPAAP